MLNVFTENMSYTHFIWRILLLKNKTEMSIKKVMTVTKKLY